MIHRGVRKVLRGIYEAEETKKIKRREEIHKEVVLTANHLVLRVMKRAYYHFNSVIALGQFVNLGFVLVASLSTLRLLLMEIQGVGGRQVRREEVAQVEDDVGEEVVFELVSKAPPEPFMSMDVMEEVSMEQKPKRQKSERKGEKKTKKKKKRSAIDDIFG